MTSEFAAKLGRFRESAAGVRFPRPATRTFEELRAYIAHGFGRAESAAHGSHLRPHQVEVIASSAKHIGAGNAQAICVAPTGSGKTEIFQSLVSGTCQRSPRTGRILVPNTVILAPTQNLIRQTFERFQASQPHLPVGYLTSNHGSEFGPITVGSYQGFVQAVLEGRMEPEDVDHLVLDEAHRSLSDLRRDVFGRFIGNTVISAYTASPVYDLTRHLFSLLGKENVVANISMKRMIDEKVLAPVVNYILRVRLRGEMPKDARVRGALLSHVAAETACSLFLEAGNEIIGKPLSERSFLGYTRGVVEAKAAADVFAGWTGKPVRSLSGRDDITEQGAAIEGLSAGSLAGLFNARLLIEGTDVPRVSLVLNLSPTNSLVNQLQRCGRGIRMDPALHVDDPAQTAAIVDIAFEVNGKPLGRPRFFFEAVGDQTIARLVDVEPREVEEALTHLSKAERRGARSDIGDDDGLETTQHVTGDDEAFEGSTDDAAQDDDPEGPVPTAFRPVSGFSIVSDLDRVQYFLRERDASALMSSEAGWIGVWKTYEAIEKMPGSYGAILRLWDEMEAASEAEGLVEIDGVAVRVKDFIQPRGMKRVRCVREEDVPLIEKLVRSRSSAWPPKDGDWLRDRQVGNELGIGFTADLKAFWADLSDKAVEGDMRCTLRGRDVRIGVRAAQGKAVACLHRDSLPDVAAVVEDPRRIPNKDDGWLNRTEILDRLDRKQVADALEARVLLDGLQRQFEQSGEAMLPDGSAVTFEVRRINNKRTSVCLAARDIEAVRRNLPTRTRDVQVRGEGWLFYSEACKAAQITKTDQRSLAAWDELLDRWRNGVATNGKVVEFKWLRSVTHVDHHIHESDIPAFMALARPERLQRVTMARTTQEWLEMSRSFDDMRHWLDSPLGGALLAHAQRNADASGTLVHEGRRWAIRMGASGVPEIHRDQLMLLRRVALGSFRKLMSQAAWDEREANWLTREDLGEICGSTKTKSFLHLWERICAAVIKDGSAVIDGRPLRAKLWEGRGKPFVCIHRDEATWFEEKLGGTLARDVLDKDEEWLNRVELASELGIGAGTTKFKKAWQAITEMAGRGSDAGMRIELRRSATKYCVCVHRDDVDMIYDILSEEETSPGM